MQDLEAIAGNPTWKQMVLSLQTTRRVQTHLPPRSKKVHNVHQGPIFDNEFKVEMDSSIDEHEMFFTPLVSHVPEEDHDHEN